MIRVKGYRVALHHATRELRKLGRDIVAGNYAPDAHPMEAPHAFIVITKAMTVVAEFGIATVFDALDASLEKLKRGELL